jgi:hypothetical protein
MSGSVRRTAGFEARRPCQPATAAASTTARSPARDPRTPVWAGSRSAGTAAGSFWPRGTHGCRGAGGVADGVGTAAGTDGAAVVRAGPAGTPIPTRTATARSSARPRSPVSAYAVPSSAGERARTKSRESSSALASTPHPPRRPGR